MGKCPPCSHYLSVWQWCDTHTNTHTYACTCVLIHAQPDTQRCVNVFTNTPECDGQLLTHTHKTHTHTHTRHFLLTFLASPSLPLSSCVSHTPSTLQCRRIPTTFQLPDRLHFHLFCYFCCFLPSFFFI